MKYATLLGGGGGGSGRGMRRGCSKPPSAVRRPLRRVRFIRAVCRAPRPRTRVVTLYFSFQSGHRNAAALRFRDSSAAVIFAAFARAQKKVASHSLPFGSLAIMESSGRSEAAPLVARLRERSEERVFRYLVSALGKLREYNRRFCTHLVTSIAKNKRFFRFVLDYWNSRAILFLVVNSRGGEQEIFI